MIQVIHVELVDGEMFKVSKLSGIVLSKDESHMMGISRQWRSWVS
jgi:hypothetical protein